MAALDTSYRPGKAMRMHIEQLEKRLRADRQRDLAEQRRRYTRELEDGRQRIAQAARATGAVVTEVWVDHPTAEGL